MDVSYNEWKAPRCAINKFSYLNLLTPRNKKDVDVLSGGNSMIRLGSCINEDLPVSRYLLVVIDSYAIYAI